MAVVTFSRLFGSGGNEIAARAAERLGYEFVDYALIVKVAEQAGVRVEEVTDFDEKYHSKTVEWLKNFFGPRIGKIQTNKRAHLDSESFIEHCKNVLHGLAEKGNIVIVGRSGQFILKDLN